MADMTQTHPAPLSEEEVSALFAQLEELIPQVEQAAADDARVQRARQAAQIFPVAEELRKALHFPEGFDFMIALAVGYPATGKDAHVVHPDRVTILK